jgi:hypothetical protein
VATNIENVSSQYLPQTWHSVTKCHDSRPPYATLPFPYDDFHRKSLAAVSLNGAEAEDAIRDVHDAVNAQSQNPGSKRRSQIVLRTYVRGMKGLEENFHLGFVHRKESFSGPDWRRGGSATVCGSKPATMSGSFPGKSGIRLSSFGHRLCGSSLRNILAMYSLERSKSMESHLILLKSCERK